MKKTQLIEIGILAVALICGYKFFETLISSAFSILYQFGYGFEGSWFAIFQYLLIAGIYLGAFVILVKKRTWIAYYIDKQGEPNSNVSEQDTINIDLRQDNLLFIILVALCLITFVTELPSILIGIYNYFKTEVSNGDKTITNNMIENVNFKSAAIKLVIAAIVLYYARPITNLFNKPSDQDDLVVKSPDDIF